MLRAISKRELCYFLVGSSHEPNCRDSASFTADKTGSQISIKSIHSIVNVDNVMVS